jgi:hypothetical protein
MKKYDNFGAPYRQIGDYKCIPSPHSQLEDFVTPKLECDIRDGKCKIHDYPVDCSKQKDTSKEYLYYECDHKECKLTNKTNATYFCKEQNR